MVVSPSGEKVWWMIQQNERLSSKLTRTAVFCPSVVESMDEATWTFSRGNNSLESEQADCWSRYDCWYNWSIRTGGYLGVQKRARFRPRQKLWSSKSGHSVSRQQITEADDHFNSIKLSGLEKTFGPRTFVVCQGLVFVVREIMGV